MPDPSPLPAPALSLSVRLTVAFTAAAFVILALTLLYIDRAVERGLIEQHQDIFADHLAALELSIRNNEGDLHAAEMLLQHTIGGDKNSRSYGCLTDAKGQLLMQTPGFSEFGPPVSTFPPPVAANDGASRLVLLDAVDKSPVLVASVLVPRAGSVSPLTYYYVADAVPTMRFLAGLRLKMGGVLLLATLFSSGLAWGISRRGLRPIETIAVEIERTTAKALQRIDADGDVYPQVTRWPREVARLAGAFNALRWRLGRAFHQLRQFSDDAAHEIRTPLNNMMGVTSLALQRDRSPEEYRAALVSTLEECDRLKKLADGLLFISRADHHRSVFVPTTFAASEAIAEVVDYHSDMAQEQNVALTVSAEGNLTADRMMFRQALTNLVSNALRHTPSGGHIEIAFDSSSDPQGPATLIVTDTGEGIAPEHLPHIFDRFYRVDSARTHHHRGGSQTGLGLAIVKAIVELHSGTVSASSRLGQGTTLVLVWRRHQAALDV